jgi:hypothetical protein
VGSGFKTFTAGSVLTASDVQNYLQDQAVMVFGGTAARSSAIGTANFEEGMLTYLTDVDKLQVYTGSSFQDVYPPAATSQGMTLINTTSFSGVSTQSINDVFSTTYDHYRILIKFVGSAGGDLRMRMRVGGADNSTSNYATELIRGDGGTNNASSFTSETSMLMGSYSTITGAIHMDLFAPFLAERTLFMSNSYYKTAGVPQIRLFNGELDVATSFTGFTLLPNSGNITGTISVYGYND